ncbi:hypothetical protein BS47DRAFT_1350775 [Hydnum rufescens UP504]|nr:hypothetical protein BS47DRAFT_1350775 [Hydnum rufescens UP504]
MTPAMSPGRISPSWALFFYRVREFSKLPPSSPVISWLLAPGSARCEVFGISASGPLRTQSMQ